MCRYDLHVLLVEHGKCCTRCAKNGKPRKEVIGPCPLGDTQKLAAEMAAQGQDLGIPERAAELMLAGGDGKGSDGKTGKPNLVDGGAAGEGQDAKAGVGGADGSVEPAESGNEGAHAQTNGVKSEEGGDANGVKSEAGEEAGVKSEGSEESGEKQRAPTRAKTRAGGKGAGAQGAKGKASKASSRPSKKAKPS